jgi:EAL domain-containing protein (putative c-di-GMP-specific phosphodiesterase class I)
MFPNSLPSIREFVAGCAEDRLKQAVCRDMVQGFLFAKPMGAKKFARTVLGRPVAMLQ